MARQGFRRNSKVISGILHNDPGGKAAIRAAAEKILAQTDDPEAHLVEYDTDRAVVGVRIPADTQAKHGTATRAAQKAAGG